MAGNIHKGDKGIMNKIIKIDQLSKIINEIKKTNKKIVLVGGFFDLMHIGHIKFLQNAKEKGDFLFVILESDETAKKLKGGNRPINNQTIRAEVLSALECVDYVINIPPMKNDNDYDKLVSLIKPDMIAISGNDRNIEHKKRQAKMLNTKLLEVVPEISNQSTSRIIKILEKEL